MANMDNGALVSRYSDPEIKMDSRDIAELTGKQHGHVCRDIISMLEGIGIDQSIFGSVYKAGNGENRRCFKLPYRETMILVSGYSVELRAKVVDRWMELEQKQSPSIPKTFSEALRLAADQAEIIESQKEQLAIAAPKVEFYDTVVSSSDTIDMGEVAKVLNYKNMGRNRLFKYLRDKKVLMYGNEPYERYRSNGWFKVIENVWEDGKAAKIALKTVVYQKGLDGIRKMLDADGYERIVE